MPDQIIKPDVFFFPKKTSQNRKMNKVFSLGEEGIESGSKYMSFSSDLECFAFYVDFTLV